jgi:H+/Cl- antiporter ClcA
MNTTPTSDANGGVLKFLQHYWLGFLWVGIALFTLIAVVGLVVYFQTPRASNQPIPYWVQAGIFAGIVGALYRAFRAGFRFSENRGATSEWVMNWIVLPVVQTALAVIAFPFLELFRQSVFLSRAWKGWRHGDVLVDAQNRMLRAG